MTKQKRRKPTGRPRKVNLQTLKKLLDDGLTQAECAEAFGVTPYAIGYNIDRLLLKGEQLTIARKRRRTKPVSDKERDIWERMALQRLPVVTYSRIKG